MQMLVKIHSFILKILIGNEILTSFKGHNSAMNWRKRMLNNSKLDVVNINAYETFGQNRSNSSQDIERKRTVTDGQTDGQLKTVSPHISYVPSYKLKLPVANLAARF